MLSMALGVPGDMRHCSLLAWKVSGFPKGCCHHDFKAFCETVYNSVHLNIIENMK